MMNMKHGLFQFVW